MKVNLQILFKSFGGEELKGEAKGKTMAHFLAQSLFSGAGVGNTPEEKFAAYKLCNRLISETGEIELDKDERKLLKDTACASLTPGAFGQVMELLEKKEA